MYGVEAYAGIRMHQPGMGKPAVEQPSHAVRGQTASLAAPLQGVPPVSADPLTESPQARPVTRHGVVLVEAVQHSRDPPAHPRYRFVHTLAKRLLDLLQFRLQTFPHRLPPDGKVPAPGGPARVREPQKREALRFSCSPLLTVGPCKPAELDPPRLVRMKLQPELRQPFPEFPEKPLGLGPVLEPHHKVSRPGESHPEPLAEPYWNVSAHTASAMEPRRTPICQCAHNFGSRLEIRATQCVALRKCLRSFLYFRSAQRANDRSSWRIGG